MDTKEAVKAIEARAKADFISAVGRTYLATKVSGYRDGDSVNLELSTPAKVRIEPTDEQSLRHWCDDWCDPYWDVTLLEPHPELEGVRSLWVDGHSYHVNGLQSEAAAITPLEWSE